MSADSPIPERDLIAAEHALRLLEGSDLARARWLESSDPAFAAEVAQWEERLASLFDEVAEAAPDPALWPRIRQAIRAGNDNDPDVGGAADRMSVRKLRLWRGYGIFASAVAASLALVIGLDGGSEPSPPQPIRPARAPALVASLASDDAATFLSVAYRGGQSGLLVSPARLHAAPNHDHELWIIPEGGQPISLGLVRGIGPQRLAIQPRLLPHFRRGSAVALSREPVGGSPTGQPTGPVVASGELLDV